MANIKTFLAQILSARYGKDVRQSIHDSIYSINEQVESAENSTLNNANVAAQCATNAKTSEANAKTSEANAKKYAEDALHGTPEGYSELVDTVGKLDIQEATGTTLENSVASPLEFVSMSGNSVQNGTPTPDAPQSIHNVGDCVDMMQGAYWYTNGVWQSNANFICNQNPVSCKSGDVVKIADLDTTSNVFVLYYNESGFVSYAQKNSVKEAEFTVPSGVTKFNFDIGYSGITPSTVGKISLTINGKHVVQINITDDNGNKTEATVLLNAPLCDTDVMSRTEVVRNRARVVFDSGDFEAVSYTYDNVVYFRLPTPTDFKDRGKYVYVETLCNKFTTKSIASMGNSFSNIGNVGNMLVEVDNVNLWFGFEIGTTLEEAQSIGEIIVEYPLATPTTEILDTDSQVALNSLETFDGATYINVDSVAKPKEIKTRYASNLMGSKLMNLEKKESTIAKTIKVWSDGETHKICDVKKGAVSMFLVTIFIPDFVEQVYLVNVAYSETYFNVLFKGSSDSELYIYYSYANDGLFVQLDSYEAYAYISVLDLANGGM